MWLLICGQLGHVLMHAAYIRHDAITFIFHAYVIILWGINTLRRCRSSKYSERYSCCLSRSRSDNNDGGLPLPTSPSDTEESAPPPPRYALRCVQTSMWDSLDARMTEENVVFSLEMNAENDR